MTLSDRTPHTPAWDIGRRVLRPIRRPLVMGIVNLTPDSFYPASRLTSVETAVSAALTMLDAGADIVDLGAESTRPGSSPVPADEEQRRLLPVLTELRRQTDAPLSVDTNRAATAEAALDAGADVINDITAGRGDPDLLPLVARTGCGAVLMHMQGTPRTMQADPHYDDIVAEVGAYLAGRVGAATAAGIAPARLLVDPGLGFGKHLEHNLALLANLRRVAGGHGLLVGASRKSFIAHITGAAVADRLGGSLAALAAALAAGACVVRVHDVAPSVQFLETLAAIDAARNGQQADVEHAGGA